jgi:hypothetical protein
MTRKPDGSTPLPLMVQQGGPMATSLLFREGLASISLIPRAMPSTNQSSHLAENRGTNKGFRKV